MLLPAVEVLRLLGTSHLVVLAAVLVKGYARDPSARASVAFIAAVCAHLLSPAFVAGRPSAALTYVMVLAGAAVPFTFWVCARVHFDDDFRLGARHAFLLAALLSMAYLSYGLQTGDLDFAPGEKRGFWTALPKLVGIVLVIHALLHVYAGARSDLLVSRLRLRYVVLTLSGSLSLLELLGDVVLRGEATRAAADLAHVVAVYALVFGISVTAMLVHTDLLRPARAAAAIAPPLDPELARHLERLLQVERVYGQEGLTIALLAEKLGAQEYKVRHLINAQLGFRNFNALLNHYRIREAATLLADPARQHLGVAQVAYEVGYGSLGPFNKAFKELNGVTPSEFRAAATPRAPTAPSAALADSENGKPFPEKRETRSERPPMLGS